MRNFYQTLAIKLTSHLGSITIQYKVKVCPSTKPTIYARNYVKGGKERCKDGE